MTGVIDVFKSSNHQIENAKIVAITCSGAELTWHTTGAASVCRILPAAVHGKEMCTWLHKGKGKHTLVLHSHCTVGTLTLSNIFRVQRLCPPHDTPILRDRQFCKSTKSMPANQRLGLDAALKTDPHDAFPLAPNFGSPAKTEHSRHRSSHNPNPSMPRG